MRSAMPLYGSEGRYTNDGLYNTHTRHAIYNLSYLPTYNLAKLWD